MEPFEGHSDDGGIITKQENLDNTSNGTLNDNLDTGDHDDSSNLLDPNQHDDDSVIPSDCLNGESSGDAGAPAEDGMGNCSTIFFS